MAVSIDIENELKKFRDELRQFCKERGFYLQGNDTTYTIDTNDSRVSPNSGFCITFKEEFITTGKILKDKYGKNLKER